MEAAYLICTYSIETLKNFKIILIAFPREIRLLCFVERVDRFTRSCNRARICARTVARKLSASCVFEFAHRRDVIVVKWRTASRVLIHIESEFYAQMNIGSVESDDRHGTRR